MAYKEELVDIVNKDDKVIGQTTKKDAHQKGLLHRTVIATLINSKGQFLLVKQANHKQDPGQYVSPSGGHVQAEESNGAALKREVSEELGITQFISSYKGKVILNITVQNHIENHFFIVYELHSDQKPILNDESVSFEWFTRNELKEKIKQNPEQFGRAFWPVFKTFYPELSN